MANCRNCSNPFEIKQDDLNFYDSVSPIFGGKKISIPPPTLCPECRQQRRLAACNERFLYPGECFLCRKRLLSQHPPHEKQPVLCSECWHGDKWNPLEYGKDFDFSRPFFEQFRELIQRTPQPALYIDGINVNCDFIHYAGSSKNCYLIMHADFCEDCYYGYGFKKNLACIDGWYNLHCELCYDCVDVSKCYDLKGSQDCMSCSSSAFLRDCVGCKNCFLCVGLRNKEFCFENQQLSKEEYFKRMAEIDTGSFRQYSSYKMRLRDMEEKHTFKAFHGHNLENSFGDYLYNCKDAQYCFNCENVERAKFCYQLVLGAKNCYDVNQFGTRLQQSYECTTSGSDSYQIVFTMNGAMTSSNVFYCYYTESARNCFGCTSIRNQQYCIMNKQYSKEEYEKLVLRIIEHMGGTRASAKRERETEARLGLVGSQPSEVELYTKEWGEFFPIAKSLFGYNKTTAQLYYPLTKEEALSKGYPWDDYESPIPDVAKTLKASELPDNISEVTDDVLKAAIECEATKKLFKITPQELRFYRQQKIPLPRKHPDQRHVDRFHKRNPRKFWKRSCLKCGLDMQTTFSPDRLEKIYCEACYLKTVY